MLNIHIGYVYFLNVYFNHIMPMKHHNPAIQSSNDLPTFIVTHLK